MKKYLGFMCGLAIGQMAGNLLWHGLTYKGLAITAVLVVLFIALVAWANDF